MLDSDEYAVSQILESLKENRTEEHVSSKEHEIEELNLDEVVKMASNTNQQPRKSLKVGFKLPKKSRSDMHIADQSKVKRQKVSLSGRIIKEIYSSSNVKEVLADQPKVKRQKVSSSGKIIKEICSSSNVKELLADQPNVKRQKVSSSGKNIKEISSSIAADQLKLKRQKVSSTSKTIKEICSSSNVKEFQADQPNVNGQKVSSTDKTVQEVCCSSNVKKFRSLRLRNPPKPFYNVLKCLSILQKKKVIDIGFGSVLEFNCAGIPSKLGHFVVDKFHANSMKLNVEMMKKRETLEIESGGFGSCKIKKLSEKRVAKEESELEMIRVSADLDSKLASFLDAKIELEVLFTSAFRKFPDCQVLIEKKDFFYSILINNDSKDDAVEAGPSSVKADQVDFVKTVDDELQVKEQEVLLVNEKDVDDVVVDEQVKVVNEEA
ncbi:hypothetical protein L1987_69701 [Smallanthus sonchifolius]|uniref:Uncharacterized protein n=1 Tax=Smallanthus sonchifolius TaxID=185202 RepID=A0ACB9B7D2_9ASTR|nr:hypothetical protein L1987_69701 [Smallanthus sonchifolius]